MIDDHARAAELVRRRRAAQAFHPDDPAARRWLAETVTHPEPAIAELARSAQTGAVPVAEVAAALDELDRRRAAADRLGEWMASHSREELAEIARAAGHDLDGIGRREVRMADLPLSQGSQHFLRRAGLWNDDVQRIDLAAPDGIIRGWE